MHQTESIQKRATTSEQMTSFMQALPGRTKALLRNWLLVIALVLIAFWIFMPILWTFMSSLKGLKEIYAYPLRFLPYEPSLENYRYMLEYLPEMPTYLKNSMIVTFGAVVLLVFLSSLMGYAFARLKFRGRDLIFYTMIIAMFIPHPGGLMAQYELMHALHLRNSLFGLILLFSSGLSVPLFIMRQTFLSMPGELEDAAMVDGANRWRVFLSIAIPYGVSGMLVVAILQFVGVWGEYLATYTMIDLQDLFTLGVGVAIFDTGGAELMQGDANVSGQGIYAATYLTTALPAVLLYLAMQKYFVKGLTEGALKF